jgi:hypothetical protein
MAPSDVHVQAIRRLDGERDGLRSRRPARRSPAGASNGVRTGGSSRPLRAEGTSPGSTQGQSRSGMENRRCAGAERQPVRGGQPPPLWLQSRRPRTRRTLAGIARGARGVGAREEGMAMQVTWKALLGVLERTSLRRAGGGVARLLFKPIRSARNPRSPTGRCRPRRPTSAVRQQARRGRP